MALAPVEDRRYRPTDCVFVIFTDLCESAGAVVLWDADARERWLAAAVWLLRQVPDVDQRMSWAFSLASCIRGSAPVVKVLGEMWRRVGLRAERGGATMGRGRGLSEEYQQLQPEIVAAFCEGASLASLASRYRVTVQTVERLIRRQMVDAAKGAAGPHTREVRRCGA